jgi:hypothetical protein
VITRPQLTAIVGAALALAACTAGSAVDAGVRPIDEVLASEITVTPDPSGRSATLTVSTSVPLACAVIYGVDDELGSIATDADMGGGAHTEHAPVLVGLEPGTEYRYVLQGSDASGTLYRSEVLRFTTPAAADAPPPGENVAPTGSVVDVSSEFSDAFAAPNAVDGDPGTEWSSAGDGDDAWITIELPAPLEVVGFAVRSRSMTDGSSIVQSFQVTVDEDHVLGPFDADEQIVLDADATVVGRRFRFDALTTTGGNTGAVEIEIYAAD